MGGQARARAEGKEGDVSFVVCFLGEGGGESEKRASERQKTQEGSSVCPKRTWLALLWVLMMSCACCEGGDVMNRAVCVCCDERAGEQPLEQKERQVARPPFFCFLLCRLRERAQREGEKEAPRRRARSLLVF